MCASLHRKYWGADTKEVKLSIFNKLNSKLSEHIIKWYGLQIKIFNYSCVNILLFSLLLLIISRHDSNIVYLLQSIHISRIGKHSLYTKKRNNSQRCVYVCLKRVEEWGQNWRQKRYIFTVCLPCARHGNSKGKYGLWRLNSWLM